MHDKSRQAWESNSSKGLQSSLTFSCAKQRLPYMLHEEERLLSFPSLRHTYLVCNCVSQWPTESTARRFKQPGKSARKIQARCRVNLKTVWRTVADVFVLSTAGWALVPRSRQTRPMRWLLASRSLRIGVVRLIAPLLIGLATARYIQSGNGPLAYKDRAHSPHTMPAWRDRVIPRATGCRVAIGAKSAPQSPRFPLIIRSFFSLLRRLGRPTVGL